MDVQANEFNDLTTLNIAICPHCKGLFRYNYKFKVQSIKPVGEKYLEAWQKNVETADTENQARLVQAGIALMKLKSMPLVETVETVLDVENINGELSKTGEIQCTLCGAILIGHFVISPVVFVKVGEPEPIRNTALFLLTKQEQGFIAFCEKKNLLAPFKQALERSYELNRPHYQKGKPRELPSTERCFINFICNLQRINSVPVGIVKLLNLNIEGNGLELWGHGRVIMVIADDQIASFLPKEMYNRYKPAPSFDGKSKVVENLIAKNTESLEEWIKTPKGYVPIKARIFMSELGKAAAGF